MKVKMNYSTPLSDMQTKQLIDISQTYQAWREASRHLRSYKGGMGWKTIGGKDYLYRVTNRSGGNRSLGPRTRETEALHAQFHEGKLRVQSRAKDLTGSLRILAGAARAAKIARVPAIVANVLRKLDEQEVLGKNLMVIGTNAVFAYEVVAGCLLDSGLTATTDCDFLWDARSSLRLAGHEMKEGGLLAVLRMVDKTFEPVREQGFSAVNSAGFMIDLVKAAPNPPWKNEASKLAAGDGLVASEIVNLKWMLSSPKFEAVAVGADGYPVPIIVPDPRAFAIYKLFLSRQDDRAPSKKTRDRRQAFAIAELIETRLSHLRFDDQSQMIFPADMHDIVGELRAPFLRDGHDDGLPDIFQSV